MSYTVREVASMLGLSPAQIRSFASQGFLAPERGARGELRFGFHDLVILRTAGELSAAQIPQRKVRRVLQRLRDQLPSRGSLAGVRVAADGDRVVVSDGRSKWNAESGQALFDFSVEDIEAKTLSLVRAPLREELDGDDWYDLGCDLELTSSDEAQTAYRRALELDPHHVDAHVNLGRLLHEDGAPAAAEKEYRAALETDPNHDTAAFNLGVALEDLGRIREAIAAYARAVELAPNNADAHYNLAGLFEKRGDKSAALRHLKEYRRLTRG